MKELINILISVFYYRKLDKLSDEIAEEVCKNIDIRPLWRGTPGWDEEKYQDQLRKEKSVSYGGEA